MAKRLLTAVVGIPLLILIVSMGGLVLLCGVAVIASIGLYEYTKVVNTDDKINISFVLEIFLGLIMLDAFYFAENYVLLSLLLSIVILTAKDIFKDSININNTVYGLFGLVYVTFFLGHLLLFKNFENGSWYIWLVFIICFATDTFAYFTGVTIGKHKLAPKISPKKSIEGSIGGVLGSMLLTGAYGYFLTTRFDTGLQLYHFVLLAFVTSLVSQLGDLAASMIKRQFGIKDYGNILPGHGGVLDRFDSVIFATPVVYYIIVLMTQN